MAELNEELICSKCGRKLTIAYKTYGERLEADRQAEQNPQKRRIPASVYIKCFSKCCRPHITGTAASQNSENQ